MNRHIWYPPKKKADSTLSIPEAKKEEPKPYPHRRLKYHLANECSMCGGSGKVRDIKTHIERDCTVCQGKGTIPEKHR
jgi:hypothetical protein